MNRLLDNNNRIRIGSRGEAYDRCGAEVLAGNTQDTRRLPKGGESRAQADMSAKKDAETE